MSEALVTMVFTDLVDSTRMKPLLPGIDQAARNTEYLHAILEPHRQHILETLEAQGGRVVKTEGDAFFLVFPSAARAALWAVEAQRRHRERPIETPLGPLRVKIGLHSGAPLVDPSNAADYVGSEVDYAARVAALARGEQVLVSEVTAAMLRAEKLPGIDLCAVGHHDLKGIGSVPLFELLFDGKMPQPFPDDSAPPSNLPPPPEGFTGRTALLAELRARLEAGGVTILKGEGGMGKTSLALRVAHDALEAKLVPGGVAWINCEVGPDRDECLRQMAKVFFGDRMEREHIERCRERVADHMIKRASLVVLDNFETVARDLTLLKGIAGVRPPRRVLVTTREVPPGLAGRVFEVRELEPAEAIELYRKCAQAAGAADKDDEELVSALCEAVGHQPLAIRMLAARAARIPLPRLLERVRSDLEVVKNQDPTLPAQHQSARACFALSIGHLSEAARALCLQLCVLPDGAGASVLTAIMGGQENWDDAASELVGASVCRLESVRLNVIPAVRQRYTMHPLVRQFALEQLGAGRAAAELRAALAVTAMVKANADRAKLGAPLDLMARALDWCEVERQTMLACAGWAFQAGQWEAVLTLATPIFSFWKVRGYWSDAERLYEQALEAARRANNPAAEAQMLNFLGTFRRMQGKLQEAEEAHGCSLALWRSLADNHGVGNTLKHLARVYQLQGRYEESERACAEALVILRAISDRLGEAKTLILLGNAYRLQERWDQAESQYEAAWHLSRKIGDRYNEGDALNFLGHIHHKQGRFTEAESSFERSLEIWRFFGDRRRQGITLIHWALLSKAHGQPALAQQQALQAVELLQATDDLRALESARKLAGELSQPEQG